MRILVCGGRDYNDRANLFAAMSEYLKYQPTLVCGMARGADRLAHEWAITHDLRILEFPADWSKGPSAGPIRNTRMLTQGLPDLVVAFPGGAGTRDMVAKAKAAGVRVVEVPLVKPPPSPRT